MCVCAWSLSCVQLFCDPMNCNLPGSSVHEDSPGKNTGVGCHALLQGIFPTQGLNPGFPHCRRILYHLSLQGSMASHSSRLDCLFLILNRRPRNTHFAIIALCRDQLISFGFIWKTVNLWAQGPRPANFCPTPHPVQWQGTMFAERKLDISYFSTPVYSCLTECPTIPQKTIPLVTPMETVLAPGRGRERELWGKR